MLLYLVRHGKAEMGDDDDARQLTPAGRVAVQRVARRLAKSNLQIEIIEHSGLARAKETAEIIQQALGGRISAVPGLRPMDNVASVGLQLLERSEDSIMLVGHLPFMEQLSGYLLTGDAEADFLRFRTAAVACLSNEEGRWQLEWLLSPKIA
jgi:phosphohistidine phosphatase